MSLNFKNLNVASLDYSEIINSLKTFLKSEPTLKDLDYDSEASAVNMLLNILATATAYNGIYAQLGYKESFLSTATLLPSIIGLASNSSVLLEAKKSASCTRNILVYGTTLDSYSAFSAVNSQGKNVLFYNIEDVSALESATITLYSGSEVVQYGDWDFNSQSMTLPLTVDPNTITMTSVATNGNTIKWEKLDKNSIPTTDSGYHFTVLNTVNGYLVTSNLPGSFNLTSDYTVYCRAVISNGAAGNDATISENSYAGFLTTETPSGGYDELEVSTARAKVNFAATAQRRCVTITDFKSAILSSSIVTASESSITVQNADEPSTIKIYVDGASEEQANQLITYLSDISVSGINLIYSE